MKKIRIIALLLICLLLAISLSACVTHIEDTNGEDDFTLVTISDEQIVNDSSFIATSRMKTQLNNRTTIKINKFSGVERLYTINYRGEKLIINTEMSVTEGNCRLVLIKGDQIVKDFAINGEDSYEFTENGVYYLKLAGESAKISLLRYILDDGSDKEAEQ